MLRTKISTASTLKRQSKTKEIESLVFLIIQKYIKKFLFISSHTHKQKIVILLNHISKLKILSKKYFKMHIFLIFKIFI